LCDEGRLDYRWLNRRDRVEYPHVRRDRALAPVDWDVAIDAAVAAMRGRRVFVLASPGLSNENLFLLARIRRRASGVGRFRVRRGPEAPLAGVADLALRADRAPNGRGAELLEFTRSETPLDDLAAGDVLLVADEELAGIDPATLAAAVGRASSVVVIGTVLPTWAREAVAVLPIANMAEDEGTFTNLRGRVQRFLQAKQAPGLVRPGWAALSDVLTGLGESTSYFQPADVFAALALAVPAFAGLTYDALGLHGAPIANGTQAAAGAR
jgi:NADH-quinone oxidoreductase subunit G